MYLLGLCSIWLNVCLPSIQIKSLKITPQKFSLKLLFEKLSGIDTKFAKATAYPINGLLLHS